MGRVGKYEILEQIGGGGVGSVFCARHITLERKVALKTIRTGVDVDPVVRQRFFSPILRPITAPQYDFGRSRNYGLHRHGTAVRF